MKRFLALAVIVVGSVLQTMAAEIGEPAKPLDIKEWIKGSPVKLEDGKGKTVYVVEFWATWCPPCRASIPHLTELQKKFKDKGVVFIGVSDEKPDVVKKFVDKMADKMDYTVAVDGGGTSATYMQAFGIDGIPHAFIVDKEGRIAWHGHPMDGLDTVIEKIISGKFDLEAAKAEAKKAADDEKAQSEIQDKLSNLAKAILAGDDNEDTKKLETELTALEKEHGNILNGEKYVAADFRKSVLFSQKVQKYQKLVASGADTNALAAAEKELTADAPKDFDLNRFKDSMAMRAEMQRASSVLQKYLASVGEGGDATQAAELAKQVEALELKNPELLNRVAWAILTEDAVKSRDVKLALNLAKRANDLTGGKQPAVIDTYARALFDNGQAAAAAEQQKKAIALADDEDMKAEFTKSLEKYESKAK